VECAFLDVVTGFLCCMMNLCCHLLRFVVLGILVHSACGLEKDDPRVDGEYPHAMIHDCSACLLMRGYILTVRNNSKVLDAVQKDCCYFGVPQNNSQSVLRVS